MDYKIKLNKNGVSIIFTVSNDIITCLNPEKLSVSPTIIRTLMSLFSNAISLMKKQGWKSIEIEEE